MNAKAVDTASDKLIGLLIKVLSALLIAAALGTFQMYRTVVTLETTASNTTQELAAVNVALAALRSKDEKISQELIELRSELKYTVRQSSKKLMD